MGDFSLDPSLSAKELLFLQNPVKKQEDPDPKKFESEMKKIKTDADQKKQRKREDEDNEGAKKIVQAAQDLIKKGEDSLYSIQKPNIKDALKKTKKPSTPEQKKPFLLPSLDQASLFFEKNDFSINLSDVPSTWIKKEKLEKTSLFQEFEMPSQASILDQTSLDLTIESAIEDIIPLPIPEQNDPIPVKDVFIHLEKTPEPPPKKNLVKTLEDNPLKLAEPQSSFLFSTPIDTSSSNNLHRLSSDLYALFERIVGVVTLLQTKTGISQTTLNLNQPQFASSIFFGSQITIEEWDSAPKEFNIRFSGTEQAVKAFTEHKQELETALTDGFETKRFRFKVHRVETDLSSN